MLLGSPIQPPCRQGRYHSLSASVRDCWKVNLLQVVHRALPPDLAVVVQVTGTRCDSVTASSTVDASAWCCARNSSPEHHI